MASAIHVNVGASLYRRSVFDELGGFDARFRYAEDYDLMFRIRDSGMKMASTDAVTLYYRMHENSLTARDHDRQMRDITLAVGLSRQRRRKLGLPAPTHFYGRPAWLARCASPQS